MRIEAIGARPETLAPNGIQNDEGAGLPIPGAGQAEGTGKSFGQFLMDAISEVNQAQMHAADLTTQFAAGKPLDVHQVMIASQEAGVMLNMAVQVRNKLVDGYQELMRINM